MAANDLFDAARDRRAGRPRPIADGRLAVRTGWALVAGLVASSVALGASLQLAGLVVVLLSTAFAYDAGLKRIPIVGNLCMGACRAQNLLLGAAVVADPAYAYSTSPLLLAGGTLGGYIALVTAISVLEDRDHDPRRLTAIAVPLITGAAALAVMAPPGPPALGERRRVDLLSLQSPPYRAARSRWSCASMRCLRAPSTRAHILRRRGMPLGVRTAGVSSSGSRNRRPVRAFASRVLVESAAGCEEEPRAAERVSRQRVRLRLRSRLCRHQTRHRRAAEASVHHAQLAGWPSEPGA